MQRRVRRCANLWKHPNPTISSFPGCEGESRAKATPKALESLATGAYVGLAPERQSVRACRTPRLRQRHLPSDLLPSEVPSPLLDERSASRFAWWRGVRAAPGLNPASFLSFKPDHQSSIPSPSPSRLSEGHLDGDHKRRLAKAGFLFSLELRKTHPPALQRRERRSPSKRITF